MSHISNSKSTTTSILIVEDDNNVRRLVTKLLGRAGYSVFAVHDGEQALEFLEKDQGEIDILITDLVLPGLGGQDLALRFKQTLPQVKVIFISGEPRDVFEAKSASWKGAFYLSKPFGRFELEETILLALDD